MCKMCVVVFVVVVAVACVAQGATVKSTFDTNLEGWTLTGNGNLSHHSTGGNPGGFAFFDDVGGPSGDGWIIAPSAFLGNWTQRNNLGSLSWDHIVLDQGGGATFIQARAMVTGPGGSATYLSPGMVSTSWQAFSVPIKQASWSVSGSWDALLSNVTELKIRIEGTYNSGPGLDDDGIDNVMLTPEPATIAMLVLGGLAVIRRKRLPV